MSTQWPVVMSRLVTLLPTLSGFTTPAAATAETDVVVYDGPPNSSAQTNYLAVGFVEDDKGAGAFTQAPEGSGFFDAETGDVRGELFIGTGGAETADLTSITATAFAQVDVIKAYLAAHRDLEALPSASTVSLSADVQRGLDASGAGISLILTFSYTVPVT